MYYVYVLRSVPTGKHYIGISADVDRRLGEHNSKRALDQFVSTLGVGGSGRI
jgi:predicted GIY-YIG superfamily endonuclease